MMNESWQEPGGAEISCAGPDGLILGQPTAVANGKADVWTVPTSRRLWVTLKRLNSPR